MNNMVRTTSLFKAKEEQKIAQLLTKEKPRNDKQLDSRAGAEQKRFGKSIFSKKG